MLRSSCHFFAACSSTRNPSGRTSLPMPSPAIAAILNVLLINHASQMSVQSLAGLQPTDMEGFDFKVFIQAVLAAFTAQARLFDAAERGDLHGNDPGVEADHAEL